MGKPHNFIAIDLGAESGRVMLATLKNDRVQLRQIHRFVNGPVEQNDTLRWNFRSLMDKICRGIEMTLALEKNIQSIGIDTWGVDYGLLDKDGKLIENPYHYRDNRNNGMMELAFKKMPQDRIYANTGIQFLPFNTLFQLIACKQHSPQVLDKARTLLFMPNLVMYYLCGEICAEYTIASTSQMMNMATGQWSREILDEFDLPGEILPPIVTPGSKSGVLKSEFTKKWNCDHIPVIAVGTHDSASAVAAVPANTQKKWAYLSSGTWSLMGIESPIPVINKKTEKMNFTNEGGVENTIRLLKNIMGLWLVQQSRHYWAQRGTELDYSKITEMASKSRPFQGLIDPDHRSFLSHGKMPEKINNYLRSTGQKQSDDKGQLFRVILESLAVKYHQVMSTLEKLTGENIEVLHIVGGGSQNELLNQFTANATGKKVIAGPIEATVMGNALVQALAAGSINSIETARKIVASSLDLVEYQPLNTSRWKEFARSFSQ